MERCLNELLARCDNAFKLSTYRQNQANDTETEQTSTHLSDRAVVNLKKMVSNIE